MVGELLSDLKSTLNEKKCPECKVRLPGDWVLQCEHQSDNAPDKVQRTVLNLPTLSPDERARITGLQFPFDVEITTIHQLVDGGVWEHLPLQLAEKTFLVRGLNAGIERIILHRDTKAFGIDTLFVLTTGESLPLPTLNRPANGIKEELHYTFESLWHSYQINALNAALSVHTTKYGVNRLVNEMELWMRKVRDWKQAVEMQVGKETFEELEQKGVRFPDETPEMIRKAKREGDPLLKRILMIDQPVDLVPDALKPQYLFSDSFDVNPRKIRFALWFGCRVAEAAFKNGFVDFVSVHGFGLFHEQQTERVNPLGESVYFDTVSENKFNPVEILPPGLGESGDFQPRGDTPCDRFAPSGQGIPFRE